MFDLLVVLDWMIRWMIDQSLEYSFTLAIKESMQILYLNSIVKCLLLECLVNQSQILHVNTEINQSTKKNVWIFELPETYTNLMFQYHKFQKARFPQHYLIYHLLPTLMFPKIKWNADIFIMVAQFNFYKELSPNPIFHLYVFSTPRYHSKLLDRSFYLQMLPSYHLLILLYIMQQNDKLSHLAIPKSIPTSTKNKEISLN